MNPMDRMYGGMEDWPASGTRSFGPAGEYGMHAGNRFGSGSGSWYGLYDRRFEEDFEGPGYERFRQGGEHVWRGGVLGWLGSGVRAGAAWVGNQMQSWGAVLGGKLKGTSAELGRAMRGRGARMGSAMEDRGEEMMRSPGYRGCEGRPSRSYRRPDDRILDDVHQRIALSGVDADDVEIEVNKGVITLSGRVPRRFDKRLIEEIAEQVFGVQEVQNHLRLARRVDENGGKRAADEGGASLGAANGEATYRASPEARS